MVVEIQELVKKAHENARSHGFWEDYEAAKMILIECIMLNDKKEDIIKNNINNAIATRLMLITSEISEALEGLRKNDYENFKEELADVAIRLGDLCGGLDIDLESEILKKMEKNQTRSYKHGKTF